MPDWIRDNFKWLAWLLAFSFTLGYNTLDLQNKVDTVEAQEIARKEVDDHALGVRDGIAIKVTVESLDHRLGSLFGLMNRNAKQLQDKIDSLERKIDEMNK